MLSYQTTDDTVNLSFSKSFLSDTELVRLIETLRIKELLAKSQMGLEDAMMLDEALKSNWWDANKEQFLAKLG